jgi:hypothetical protein
MIPIKIEVFILNKELLDMFDINPIGAFTIFSDDNLERLLTKESPLKKSYTPIHIHLVKHYEPFHINDDGNIKLIYLNVNDANTQEEYDLIKLSLNEIWDDITKSNGWIGSNLIVHAKTFYYSDGKVDYTLDSCIVQIRATKEFQKVYIQELQEVDGILKPVGNLKIEEFDHQILSS